MKHKWTFANVALIAVAVLGIAFGNSALAQEGPAATPPPEFQQPLDQAQPGGVPLGAIANTAVPVVPAQPGGVPLNATLQVATETAVATDATPETVVPEVQPPVEIPQDAAEVAPQAAPCQINGPVPCSLIYIPVMIRADDGAPNEAQPLSRKATVAARATQKAKTPTPVPPTATKPVATATQPAPTATKPVATVTKPAATATAPAATATPTKPAPTATKPAATATATATAPAATATSAPSPGGNCLNCVDPQAIVPVPNPAPNVSGQPCPAWAHDLWVVTGPNGKRYRTWHPPTQPEGMAGAGCSFNHSHGTTRDPRLSKAENSLPAYGYDADLHGMAEPHAGFKTEWANKGDCNTSEDFCSTSDLKLTVHMGTAGAGRLTLEDHTFIFDMVGHQGSIVHVRGMASTGDAASQCDPSPETSGPRGFRLIAMPKDQALACNIHSPYEVWQFHLAVGDNVIISKFANFDGVTVGRRQPDRSFKLESTAQTWPYGPFSGCQHDVYFGGFMLNSNVDGPDAHGVRQVIKIGSDQGRIVLDTVGKNTYKRPFDGCGPVTYTAN